MLNEAAFLLPLHLGHRAHFVFFMHFPLWSVAWLSAIMELRERPQPGLLAGNPEPIWPDGQLIPEDVPTGGLFQDGVTVAVVLVA